ncbi:Uncharacterised protein [Yersinia aldovae]|uniref:hypothetical protein n=1 Tax=Yersinia aldovae TaxID=29483 RepID=UPI0005E958CB|nr:hypothetical protein [Yersinia aldovae]CNJ18823.1 Uncharacterised protein [Yersinia aldovae]
MDKYNRALQLEILNTLIKVAPRPLTDEEENKLFDKFNNYDHFVANMLYLEMHRLIGTPFNRSVTTDGVSYTFNSYNCYITEKGIDFLLDDGGLSAILNVQTIRIHNDTIIALEDIIALSSIPEDQKKGLISKLRELPANAITHLTNELVVKGAMSLPVALPLIQKYLLGG